MTVNIVEWLITLQIVPNQFSSEELCLARNKWFPEFRKVLFWALYYFTCMTRICRSVASCQCANVCWWYRHLLCNLRCKPAGASVKCRAQVLFTIGLPRTNCLFTLRRLKNVIIGTAMKQNQINSGNLSGVRLGDQVLNCRPFNRYMCLPRSIPIFKGTRHLTT